MPRKAKILIESKVPEMENQKPSVSQNLGENIGIKTRAGKMDMNKDVQILNDNGVPNIGNESDHTIKNRGKNPPKVYEPSTTLNNNPPNIGNGDSGNAKKKSDNKYLFIALLVVGAFFVLKK